MAGCPAPAWHNAWCPDTQGAHKNGSAFMSFKIKRRNEYSNRDCVITNPARSCSLFHGGSRRPDPFRPCVYFMEEGSARARLPRATRAPCPGEGQDPGATQLVHAGRRRPASFAARPTEEARDPHSLWTPARCGPRDLGES